MKNAWNQKKVLDYLSWGTITSNKGGPRKIWDINLYLLPLIYIFFWLYWLNQAELMGISFRYWNRMVWFTFEPILMFSAMKYFLKLRFSQTIEFLGVQLMKNAWNQTKFLIICPEVQLHPIKVYREKSKISTKKIQRN